MLTSKKNFFVQKNDLCKLTPPPFLVSRYLRYKSTQLQKIPQTLFLNLSFWKWRLHHAKEPDSRGKIVKKRQTTPFFYNLKFSQTHHPSGKKLFGPVLKKCVLELRFRSINMKPSLHQIL